MAVTIQPLRWFMKYTIKLYCVVLICRVRRGEILVDKTYRLTGVSAPYTG